MDYQQYYTNQAGSGYPVFHGTRFQRGYGLGNIFRGLIRWITPIIKTHALPVIAAGSKEIGREAIKTFSNVATDTLNGRQFNQAFKERGSEAINSLTKKVEDHIQKASGKRKKKKKLVFNRNKKRTKKDIFDNEFLT